MSYFSFVRSSAALPIFLMAGVLLAVMAPEICRADDSNKPPDSGELFKFEGSVDQAHLTPNLNAGLKFVDQSGTKAMEMSCQASSAFPGVDFPIPTGGWDLSGYTGVEVDLVNTGQSAVTIALRIDNVGDWTTAPWSADAVTLNPGDSKTLQVFFGKSYGQAGFPLDPAHVTAVKIFAQNPTAAATVVMSHLAAFK